MGASGFKYNESGMGAWGDMDVVFPDALSSTLSRGKLQGARARPIGTTPIWSCAAGYTGQTGLTRGRARFLLQDSSIVSRKRKRSRSL